MYRYIDNIYMSARRLSKKMYKNQKLQKIIKKEMNYAICIYYKIKYSFFVFSFCFFLNFSQNVESILAFLVYFVQ